jgi:peptide/nickel transport system permease protein
MAAALAYVAALFIAAIFAPYLAPYDPLHQNIADVLQKPSPAHWLGTDEVGRDVFSRVIFGTRVALQASLQAVGLALLIGVPIGLVVGFLGRWTDRVAMRLTDVVQALPGLVVAFSVIAVLGRGLTQAMIAVSLLFATNLIRITRGVALVERERLYVDAGRVLGLPTANLLFRQILPNIAAPVVVQATIYLGTAQLIEASLSFLGLGLDPTEPSWGGMLSLAASYQSMQPALAYGPGLALTLSVLSFNILGDGLRDLLGAGNAVRRRTKAPPPAVAPAGATTEAEDEGAAVADGAVLEVGRIAVEFPQPGGPPLQILHGVSFALRRGEAVGLVGESGSGKTMTALSIMGLIPPGGAIAAGSVKLAGRDLVGLTEAELGAVRGKEIAMIFQDPLIALSPVHTIRQQMIAPMRRHLGMNARQATERAAELLAMVGIANARDRLADYPHQFSGGMAQRVMIAMALACEPRVLIADEPTTALDVTVQAQVLDVLTDLKERMGLAILISTHDLGVVADVCDRALVMYAGEVVESGDVATMFARPRHPYTCALLNAMPRNAAREGRLQMIVGQVPPPWAWPSGCRFHPRCDHAAAMCARAPVPIVDHVRCVRAAELSLGDVA